MIRKMLLFSLIPSLLVIWPNEPSAREIRISNTGECSINVGIVRGSIPSRIECDNVSSEVLDEVRRAVSEIAWSEHSFLWFRTFLPSTWRSNENDADGLAEAWPRSGTLHSELDLRLEVQGLRIAHWRAVDYGWNALQIGPDVIPDSPHYFSLDDQEYAAVARTHLFFASWDSAALEDGTDNFTQFAIDREAMLEWVLQPSEIVTIGSYPYCEGDDLVPDSARALFTSDISSSERVEFAIHVIPETYFPAFSGYGTEPDYKGDERASDEPFQVIDFTMPDRSQILSLRCSGVEQRPTDVFSVCRSILSQVELQNLGQFSC